MKNEDKAFWRKIYLQHGMNWFISPTENSWMLPSELTDQFDDVVSKYEETVYEPVAYNFTEKFEKIDITPPNGKYAVMHLRFKQEFVDRFFEE